MGNDSSAIKSALVCTFLAIFVLSVPHHAELSGWRTSAALHAEVSWARTRGRWPRREAAAGTLLPWRSEERGFGILDLLLEWHVRALPKRTHFLSLDLHLDHLDVL